MRSGWAVGLVLLALAGSAIAAPPKDAVFELDEVEYLYVTGVNRTDTAVLGPAPDGSGQLPIESCAFLQLHPPTTNGVLRVHGLQEGLVDLDLRVDQFRLPDGKRGYAFDQPVAEDGVPSFADVAIAGNGSMRVMADAYYDPLGSTGIPDLDRELPQMVGSVLVLRDGVRDDATGATLDGAAIRDAEFHVHVRSNADAAPRSITYSFVSPEADTPAGTIPVPTSPSEAYGDSYTVNNLKFGGTATFSVASTSLAPAGMNDLAFVVVAPNGTVVANLTQAPALLQDDSASAQFPLDAFGFYTVRVTGSTALAQYTATLEMAPPPQFDLHLWWENVTYGHQAYLDYRACLDVLGSPNSIIATDRVVGRPDPPQFGVAYAVMGAAGAVAVVTLAIKLAADQLSLAAFRKNK